MIEAEAVYFPWICAASTLLDAFVDQALGSRGGQPLATSSTTTVRAEMVERLCEIVHRSAHGARRLRNGERHALIVDRDGLDVPVEGRARAAPSCCAATRAIARGGRLVAARAAADHARDAGVAAARRRLTPSANYLRKGG